MYYPCGFYIRNVLRGDVGVKIMIISVPHRALRGTCLVLASWYISNVPMCIMDLWLAYPMVYWWLIICVFRGILNLMLVYSMVYYVVWIANSAMYVSPLNIGHNVRGSNEIEGEETTTGESGACARGAPAVRPRPFAEPF